MDNHAANLPAGDLRRIGFFPPRRRFGVAAYLAAWGVAGLLSTTVPPGFAAHPDHIMLYFLFLMAGVLLVLLGVAAQDLHVAERAAARFEGWIRTLFHQEPRT